MPASKTKSASNAGDQIVSLDRRRGERRDGNPTASDAGIMEQPRRKNQRRRHIDPTTCERDYSEQEVSFMRAMDDYKRASGRMFPTCSEVLEVIRSMGYVQLTPEQAERLGVSNDESDERSDDELDAELIDEQELLEV